ncbi:hypothetical protein [Paenibacillus sp. W2I17]|uniref:hypothetical protein n=1 Tax=Paenibacillus sp. W2I17 TaxID=3042311 RepID=UPI0027862C77|nr:hypothetical protein [Paenibacillus sp. W2I17]MDQ0656041.1 hypothetical protein [Paenibacillus sp. W2I17]
MQIVARITSVKHDQGEDKIAEEITKSKHESKSKRSVEGQEHDPIEVAILAAFYFIGTSSCPKPMTRTCTDCRNRQEHGPVSD